MKSIRDSWRLLLPRGRDSRGCRLALAAVTQTAGALVAWALLPAGFAQAVTSGLAAALLGRCCGLPRWWQPIQLALPLAAWVAIGWALEPWWYLAAFALTFATLGCSPGTAVPLLPSGRSAIATLARIAPRRARLLDAGCGAGGVLAALARARPDLCLEGVESAPLPWAVARLRACCSSAHMVVRCGDLWRTDFGSFDVVYAFLSPEPMTRLWHKARREMRRGSLLVSNGFPVDGERPERVVEPARGSDLRLYVWRM